MGAIRCKNKTYNSSTKLWCLSPTSAKSFVSFTYFCRCPTLDQMLLRGIYTPPIGRPGDSWMKWRDRHVDRHHEQYGSPFDLQCSGTIKAQNHIRSEKPWDQNSLCNVHVRLYTIDEVVLLQPKTGERAKSLRHHSIGISTRTHPRTFIKTKSAYRHTCFSYRLLVEQNVLNHVLRDKSCVQI